VHWSVFVLNEQQRIEQLVKFSPISQKNGEKSGQYLIVDVVDQPWRTQDFSK
jgi:hypothetical protein